jgi:hypothetical protein
MNGRLLTSEEGEANTITRWTAVGLFAGCAIAAGAWALVRRSLGNDRLDSVARVGEEYLRSQPAGFHEHAQGSVAPELARRTRAAAFHQLDNLATAVKRDFEQGDVVRVDGWLLSSNEARAAALVALGRRRRGWSGGRRQHSRPAQGRRTRLHVAEQLHLLLDPIELLGRDRVRRLVGMDQAGDRSGVDRVVDGGP